MDDDQLQELRYTREAQTSALVRGFVAVAKSIASGVLWLELFIRTRWRLLLWRLLVALSVVLAGVYWFAARFDREGWMLAVLVGIISIVVYRARRWALKKPDIAAITRTPSDVQSLPVDQLPPSEKERVVALILCWTLGIFGAHRFYVEKHGTAVIMVLTLGGLGVWTLVDFVLILLGRFRDKKGSPLSRWTNRVSNLTNA